MSRGTWPDPVHRAVQKSGWEAAGRPSSALPRSPGERNCCDRHTPLSLSAEAGPRHLPSVFRQVSEGRGTGHGAGLGAFSRRSLRPCQEQLLSLPSCLWEPSGAFRRQSSPGPGCVCEMRCRTARGVCARSCFAQPAPDFHLLTGMTLRACECRVARADMPEMACQKALPAKVKGRCWKGQKSREMPAPCTSQNRL